MRRFDTKMLLVAILLLASSANGRYASINIIRDEVTPEEISEVILNPRKRDITPLSSAQNQIEAAKIQTIVNQQQIEKASKHEREVRAVKKITTRLQKVRQEEVDFSPDHFVKKTRLLRAAPAQGPQKPKPLPAAFLTAVARVVVPEMPESTATAAVGEATPRLLRLRDAK